MTSTMIAKSKHKLKYEIRDGILNNLYCAGELDSFGVKEYPELDHIPTDNISVREAAQNQSSSTGIGFGLETDLLAFKSSRLLCKKNFLWFRETLLMKKSAISAFCLSFLFFLYFRLKAFEMA
ncbi:hypothetical protein RhiirA4_421770 [Rhizophagus irregularis]|uniref:Uncharacterized protein n=1 Tax=Rhizophagus irregularis TaxID=588596 RepID=A0A2I1GMN4_9GLOM|nr:hypothetical protein RhiirA4_421770 [Rhizophagus irregularis]